MQGYVQNDQDLLDEDMRSVLCVAAFEIFGRTQRIGRKAIGFVPPDVCNPFHGIIDRMHFICCADPHKEGLIEVYGFWGHLSEDELIPNESRTFDFKTHMVGPCGYTILSLGHVLRGAWVLEGSNDGVEWKEIDRREHHDPDVVFCANGF